MSNLLQPYVLLRIVAAMTGAALFLRAFFSALRVLRGADLADKSRATEAQLLLERRVELTQTLARAAALFATVDVVLGVFTADRLAGSLRGAMCAYGVFTANRFGPMALAVGVALALGAGVVAQLFAFDARLPRLALARPLATATALLAPVALAHAALSTLFLLSLDLSATASCCSVELDAGLGAAASFAHGPGRFSAVAGGASLALAAVLSLLAGLRRSPALSPLVAVVALVAGLAGTAAIVFSVAPHVFETPRHLCPFCLLHGDVGAIGAPLFAALYLGVVWSVGAALAARLAPAEASLRAFLRSRLLRSGVAFALVLVIGAAPILRYRLAFGALLFSP